MARLSAGCDTLHRSAALLKFSVSSNGYGAFPRYGPRYAFTYKRGPVWLPLVWSVCMSSPDRFNTHSAILHAAVTRGYCKLP